MKFFEFLKNKKKELLKPDLVTLVKYKAIFKTADGEWHEYDNHNYADPDSILCTIPEYIMKSIINSKKYMKDNDFNMYPLENIICIKWEVLDIIENVIKKWYGCEFSYTFYDEDDIKIWSENK